MDWVGWTISGTAVGSGIIIAIVRGIRGSHTVIHKRIDHTRNECKDTFADKEAFTDFRGETRECFKTLNTKVDDIPQKVKNLLDGGN